MQNLAPIALFVYNRLAHVKETIKALAASELAKESALYIFSDGAHSSNTSDSQKVEQVRKFISKITGFKKISIIQRPANIGLAHSIIQGVTLLNQQYGKVIVIEDDLICSPHLLSYLNHALNFYQNEPKVMHISAYLPPINSQGLPETFFFRATTCWGWATWNRAWKHFNPDAEVLHAAFSKDQIKAFSLDGTENYWKQLQNFRAGKNQSWAIRWYASVFLAQGLCLHPAASFTQNIGNDGSGRHCPPSIMYDVALAKNAVKTFPTLITENPLAYQRLKQFSQTRKGSLLRRLCRFLRMQCQTKMHKKPQ